MCNCLEDIRNKISDDVNSRFSKPNKPVQCFEIRATLGRRAVVNISIYLKNQQKVESSFIVADYCPWCGVKYGE